MVIDAFDSNINGTLVGILHPASPVKMQLIITCCTITGHLIKFIASLILDSNKNREHDIGIKQVPKSSAIVFLIPHTNNLPIAEEGPFHILSNGAEIINSSIWECRGQANKTKHTRMRCILNHLPTNE